jgi:hypothetical protein
MVVALTHRGASAPPCLGRLCRHQPPHRLQVAGRYRSGAASALVDRRSVRLNQLRMLEPLQLQHPIEHRPERCTLRGVARVLCCTALSRGPGSQGHGARPAQEPPTGRAGPPQSVSQAWRHDPRRHQIAGLL